MGQGRIIKRDNPTPEESMNELNKRKIMAVNQLSAGSSFFSLASMWGEGFACQSMIVQPDEGREMIKLLRKHADTLEKTLEGLDK